MKRELLLSGCALGAALCITGCCCNSDPDCAAVTETVTVAEVDCTDDGNCGESGKSAKKTPAKTAKKNWKHDNSRSIKVSNADHKNSNCSGSDCAPKTEKSSN